LKRKITLTKKKLRTKLKSITQSKLGLNDEIEKTIIERSSKKNRNKKNIDKIKRYNVLQIEIKGLNCKDIKLLLKSQGDKNKK
jgi:hypothetical protein